MYSFYKMQQMQWASLIQQMQHTVATKMPRPTKPIAGIPNNPIKLLNKKSNEIDSKKKNKNSKIHTNITVHDHILNKYVSKLNKEKNTNREELITKLRKRFVVQFNNDTVAHFSGNRIYILMFDLDEPLSTSST
ncbi:unnamed protein product [Psylliodes chrysocephalus]|uniref:Uncharacterized protein n=1 Tax=Psylliodes chrysocephalus TaxID=3402493 RepID=A0A9P0GHP6_9CUCU|nr:unnamed protein product [Psylliodes chrysocephala]